MKDFKEILNAVFMGDMVLIPVPFVDTPEFQAGMEFAKNGK